MDAEMASWRSTCSYVDAVSPPQANVVDGMWIFKVKRSPGLPPVLKACYVGCALPQFPTPSAFGAVDEPTATAEAAAISAPLAGWGRRMGGRCRGGGGGAGTLGGAHTYEGIGSSFGGPSGANTDEGAMVTPQQQQLQHANVSLSFILDAATSQCFFRDCTTLSPLRAPLAVSLANPSSGPFVARSATSLPSPAVPSGSLTGVHIPSFSRNLVGVGHLHDLGVVEDPTLGRCSGSRCGGGRCNCGKCAATAEAAEAGAAAAGAAGAGAVATAGSGTSGLYGSRSGRLQ
ncbi:unnamed protein product [Closterium sp. NIES-54]